MLKRRYNFFWLIALLVGLAWVSIGCLGAPDYEYKGTVLDPPAPLPDFELKDVNGQSFRLSEVKGDIALIYFGYTYCPDVCPLTMVDVKEALGGLKTNKEHVHVIFIYFSFVHFNRCGNLAFNTQENIGATPFIRQV